MTQAGRVGDQAKCPTCSNEGPAQQGSTDTFINNQAALRVGDPGKHSGCTGDGKWKAEKGSRSVLINGVAAHRTGDATQQGGGTGQLVEGSPNVQIGDKGGGTAAPVPHDRSLDVSVKDAVGRPLAGATATASCPHKDDAAQKFTGSTTVSGLCSSSTVTVAKPLQTGTWDKGASSGEVFPPTHAQVSPATHADTGTKPEKPAPPPPQPPSPSPNAAPAASPASPAAPPASPAASPDAAAATADDTHVVHAPVSPGTPGDTHEAHIVRPTTSSATVQVTTVHNWVELVFKAFGNTMPTGATEIAILGVREASLSGKGGVDTLEAEAGAGQTDKETTTREQRDAVFSSSTSSAHATTWNDLLFIAFTTSTPDHAQSVEVFECTIDAGAWESAAGIPVTLEGKLYGAQPGEHIPSRYPGSDVALHLFYKTPGKMALARECTGTRRTFEEIASAENANTGWLFCSDEDNASIHMHFGSENGNVGNWSTGCTVLHHHLWIKNAKGVNVQDPKATRYKRFMELYRGASNKKNIPYLVVSSEYVRSYAEWVRLVDQTPGEGAKPESVIMKDKLVAAPGAAGQYLPSFVTAKFASAVDALAADAKTSKTHAANLRSSMGLITFTLSI
jgi:uncharacterized Zn-binding protein involved in type VI secretion